MHNGVGIKPSIFPEPILTYISGTPVIALPFVIIIPRPANTCIVPNVASIAGTFKTEIKYPFRTPHKVPIIMQTGTHNTIIPAIAGSDIPVSAQVIRILAHTIAERLATPTKDKSIPPAIIANITPNAINPYSGN